MVGGGTQSRGNSTGSPPNEQNQRGGQLDPPLTFNIKARREGEGSPAQRRRFQAARGEMSQVRPLWSPVPTSRPGRRGPVDPRAQGRGRRVEPAHPRPHAPLPPAVRLQCHCPILTPSSPETQSVLCLSAHSAARSHQLVFVPSHPALHTKETWDRAASPPQTPERPGRGPLLRGGGGTGTRQDPSVRRTPLPLPRVSGVWYCPPAGWRGPARTRGPLQEGCPLTPPAKAATRQSPLREIPGQAKRRKEGPGAPPPPPPPRARLQSPAGRVAARLRRITCAPARAAPARCSRALPLPPGFRLLRPSGCRTLPDRAPNPTAQSPSLLFGPPVQPSAAPIGGTRAGSHPITGPAGRRGPEPAPHRGARGTLLGRAGRGRAMVRARVGAGGRGPPVEAPLDSLFFC